MVPRTCRMSFGVDPSIGPEEAIYSTPLMLRWIARWTSDWIRSGIDARSRPAVMFISVLPRRTIDAWCAAAAASRDNHFLAHRNSALRSIRFGYSVAPAAMRPWQKAGTNQTK